MATELRPLGVRCNIACRYCYQEPSRALLHADGAYDLAAMLESAIEIGAPLSVFGGEPLLLPLADLETLFAIGKERLGGASIQSNGVLITDAHLTLFARHDVRVGISLDGPDELNELRWAYSTEKTKTASEGSMNAIRQLCRAGRAPSVIVTLHRSNGRADRLTRLLNWLRELEGLGVRYVRLHLLESESDEIRNAHGLSDEETVHALHALLELEKDLTTLRFDVFDDIRLALDSAGQGATTCIWHACDVFTTAAVQGIEGDGSRSNCGRTNKEGIEFMKADSPSYERYLALYHTPQQHGGCQGCRFFLACKGQCPGTAIDGDWRNRTEHCHIWLSLMETLEGELLGRGVAPVSRHERRAALEAAMIAEWSRGRNPRPATLLATLIDKAPNAAS